MKIWQLKGSSDEFKSFQLKGEEGIAKKYFSKDFFNEQSVVDTWNTPELEQTDGKLDNDCPHFWGATGVLLISSRAKDVLQPVFGEDVEYLPSTEPATGDTYYFLKPRVRLDALDHEKSVLKSLPSGLVYKVDKFVFKDEAIQDRKIFNILLNGNLYSIAVLVSDEVKNVVTEAGLKGFVFEEL